MENLIIYAFIYLLGSIPFGLILAKFFAKIDIKKEGSKSIGATNVLRVVKEKNPKLAKKLAIATIILDFAKAAIPLLLILKFLHYDQALLWSVAVLAIFGHCFSIYLLFEGGKGIATGAGAMIVLLPLEVLTAFIVWVVIGKIFKISSLASLAALLAFVVSSFIFNYDLEIHTHAPVFIIAFIIVYKHLPNIKRLIFKEECKVI